MAELMVDCIESKSSMNIFLGVLELFSNQMEPDGQIFNEKSFGFR
jgi:hypothetical protein